MTTALKRTRHQADPHPTTIAPPANYHLVSMQYFSFLAPLAAFLLLSAALQNNEDIEAGNSIFTRSEDELETIPAYANSLFARGEDEEDLHYVHPNYGCRACTCTARVIAPGNGDYFDIGNSNGKLLEALGKGNCATGGQMSDTSGFWEPLSKDRCTDASYKKCKAFSIRGWFQIYRLAGNGPSWSMCVDNLVTAEGIKVRVAIECHDCDSRSCGSKHDCGVCKCRQGGKLLDLFCNATSNDA